MAPDSHKVRLVLGSSMAGRRPLGLILVKESSLGFAIKTYTPIREARDPDMFLVLTTL